MNTISLKEFIDKSNIVRSPNLVKDKNNCLGEWRDELQKASDKIKFDRCKEYAQLGFLCDTHPGCHMCPYSLPDDVYVSFGGKLKK